MPARSQVKSTMEARGGDGFITVEFFQRSMKELEERLLRSVQAMLSGIVVPPVQQNAVEVKPKKAKKGKKPKPAGRKSEPTGAESAVSLAIEVPVTSPAEEAEGEATESPEMEMEVVEGAPPARDNLPGLPSDSEDDETGFTRVERRKSRKRPKPATSDSESSNDGDSGEETRPKAKAGGKSATPPVKSEKIPPVILRTHECNNSWTQVSALLKAKNIAYKQAKTTRDGIRILPMSADHFRALTAAFDEAKLPYHSFALKSEKGLKVVLKGIDRNISTEDVKTDLEKQGYHPVRVNRMRKRQKNLDMVVIEVPREEAKIYAVSRVCGLVVKTEPQKHIKSSGQCHRCQKFGHTQRGCRAAPKCVRCANAHDSRDCPDKGKKKTAKCANCGGPHPASHRGCPLWPQQGTNSGTAKAATGAKAPAASKTPQTPAQTGKSSSPTGKSKSPTVQVPVSQKAGPRPSGGADRGGPSSPGKKPTLGDFSAAMSELWHVFRAANPSNEITRALREKTEKISSFVLNHYG